MGHLKLIKFVIIKLVIHFVCNLPGQQIVRLSEADYQIFLARHALTSAQKTTVMKQFNVVVDASK